MKNQIKNIIYQKTFIFTVLVLFLIGGAFYWFAYRPTQIRQECYWIADGDDYSYDFCLHMKGLK